MNSKGMAQPAYENGLYIRTAGQGYPAALDSSELGHERPYFRKEADAIPLVVWLVP